MKNKLFIILIIATKLSYSQTCRIDTSYLYYEDDSSLRGKTIYKYNSQGLEIEKVSYSYISQTNTWSRIAKTIQHWVVGENNRIDYLINQLSKDEAWENTVKYIFIPNKTGDYPSQTIITQKWKQNQWVNYTMDSNYYYEGKIIHCLYGWNNDEWEVRPLNNYKPKNNDFVSTNHKPTLRSFEINKTTCDQLPIKKIPKQETNRLIVNTITPTIYPNPATDKITLDFSKSRRPSTLKIIDLKGNLKIEINPSFENTQIDIQLSNIDKGIYILIGIDKMGKEIFNTKFEKQ